MSPVTEPCPRNDGGICTIPDQTLFFRGSEISIRNREDVERDHPGLDLSLANALPVELRVSDRDLLEAASAGGDESDEDELAGTTMTLTPNRIRSELLRVFATSPATQGVIVQCSCGDRYIKDV